MSAARGMTETNATRDVDHFLTRFNMGLQTIDLPWIRPSAWLSYLLERYPMLVCGVKNELEKQLESFWTCYQILQPGHFIFKFDRQRWRKTVPLLLHGDEGRYLKRSNYMICTVESCLGSFAKCPKFSCDCGSDPVLARYPDLCKLGAADPDTRKAIQVASRQCGNAKGHSYLSKFLCFGMASKEYKEHPELLHQAFKLVAEDTSLLCTEGVAVPSKGRFYGAILGIKGDMKFHHQIGHLQRSYYNLGRKSDYPICHLCGAGGPGVPFDELVASPVWQGSLFTEPPWPQDDPPSLAQIPFDELCQSKIFALDPFHLWKMGTGRDLCGSSVVVLARLGMFDFEEGCTQNIEDRLARALSCFRLWCVGNSKTPALRTFTKLNFMCKDQSCFPWVNCKGSDTTLLTHWLLFFLRVQIGPVDDSHKRLCSALEQTLQSAIIVWQILHTHRVWLNRPCAQRLEHHLLRALRGFKVAAAECHGLGLAGFGLKPKLHALHHVVKDVESQLNSGALRILNPLVFSCEGNEDMVGRISRLARRVSARCVNKRVFDRLMYKTKALIRKKFGRR